MSANAPEKARKTYRHATLNMHGPSSFRPPFAWGAFLGGILVGLPIGILAGALAVLGLAE
jgi:predicted lipid-binding transport protein (Tim44 family)